MCQYMCSIILDMCKETFYVIREHISYPDPHNAWLYHVIHLYNKALTLFPTEQPEPSIPDPPLSLALDSPISSGPLVAETQTDVLLTCSASNSTGTGLVCCGLLSLSRLPLTGLLEGNHFHGFYFNLFVVNQPL